MTAAAYLAELERDLLTERRAARELAARVAELEREAAEYETVVVILAAAADVEPTMSAVIQRAHDRYRAAMAPEAAE